MYLLPYLLAVLAGFALHFIAPHIPFLTAVLSPIALFVIVLFAVVLIVHAVLLLFKRQGT